MNTSLLQYLHKEEKAQAEVANKKKYMINGTNSIDTEDLDLQIRDSTVEIGMDIDEQVAASIGIKINVKIKDQEIKNSTSQNTETQSMRIAEEANVWRKLKNRKKTKLSTPEPADPIQNQSVREKRIPHLSLIDKTNGTNQNITISKFNVTINKFNDNGINFYFVFMTFH